MSMKRRLSTRSASAPASRAMRKNGKVVAACTRATIAGDGLRVVMSQPAPTSCIQVPTLEISVAVQSSAKDRREKRSEEQRYELQSIMPISSAVYCWRKKQQYNT